MKSILFFILYLNLFISFTLPSNGDEMINNRVFQSAILPEEVVVIDAVETGRKLYQIQDTFDGYSISYRWVLMIPYIVELFDGSTLQIICRWQDHPTQNASKPATSALMNLNEAFYIQRADVLRISNPKNHHEWSHDNGKLMSYELFRDDILADAFQAFTIYKTKSA